MHVFLSYLKEGVFTGIVLITDDSSVEDETGLPTTKAFIQ